MNDPAGLPIPPIDTATEPVRSASDLRQRWRALMGPLGFGQKLLWIGFLGPDRRLLKTMSQVPIGPRPKSQVSTNLMSALRSVLNGMPSGFTVALLLTGPGQGAISATDRHWAKSLSEAATRFDVPLETIFRANDESLLPVEPA
jgi:hypothetical protein